MLRRVLLVAAGVSMLVAARAVVAAGERLAFENPEATRLRSTTIPSARAEGLLALWIALRGRWPAGFGPLLAATGAVLLASPRRTVDAALAIAYRNAGEIEPRPWVVPLTRLVGVAHLVVALRILGRRRRDD